MATETKKIINRRDTAARWESANPILASGEIGIDTTNNEMKVGDGKTAWNELKSERRRIFLDNVSQEFGVSEGKVMSQNAVSGSLALCLSAVSVEPIMMIGKFYNSASGILQDSTSLDCTQLIKIPKVRKIRVDNGSAYYISCYDENKGYLGGSFDGTSIVENAAYIGVSFFKSSQFDYSKVKILYEEEDGRDYICEGEYVGDRVYLTKGYRTTDGALLDFENMDCTPMIPIPYGCEYINLSTGPYYTISCFDADKKNIGATGDAVKTGRLLTGTRYVGINFLKSDSINYSELYIRFSNRNLTCGAGERPGMLLGKAIHSTRGELVAFPTLDCTIIEKVPSLLDEAIVNCTGKFYEVACFDAEMAFLGCSQRQLLAGTRYFSVSFLKSENIYYADLRISLSKSTSNALTLPSTREGKKFYLFGDSITYWDSRPSWYDESVYMKAYPSYIRDVLGAAISNHGIAGQRSDQITDRLLTTNLNDAYAVTYMAGSNDIQQNVSLDTYKSNLRRAVEYVATNYPAVKFYFISPPYYVDADITPYGDAMQEVAEEYAIPIIRWDKVGRINKISTSYLTVDGLHPNNDGHRVFADVLIPFLQNN